MQHICLIIIIGNMKYYSIYHDNRDLLLILILAFSVALYIFDYIDNLFINTCVIGYGVISTLNVAKFKLETNVILMFWVCYGVLIFVEQLIIPNYVTTSLLYKMSKFLLYWLLLIDVQIASTLYMIINQLFDQSYEFITKYYPLVEKDQDQNNNYNICSKINKFVTDFLTKRFNTKKVE